MAWQGGYDGTLWTREQFQKVVDDLKVPSWVKGITLHHTAAPTIEQGHKTPGGYPQRMRNLGHHYKVIAGWSAGPHLFIFDKFFDNKQIGEGTPLSKKGVHAASFNSTYWGVEMLGFYDKGKDDPYTAWGEQIIDEAAWVFAVLLKKLNKPANNDTIKFHRDDPKTRKTCPGSAIDKADFIRRVQVHLGVSLPEDVVKPAPEAPKPSGIGSAKEIQERLIAWGYDLGSAGADGIIGPVTEAAIKEFQKKMGVAPTGKVGTWIWSKLKENPVIDVSDPTPPPEHVPANPSDPNLLKGKDRPLYVKKVLMELGWTEFQSAAMVGNLMRESYPDLRSNVWGDWMIGKKIVKAGTVGASPTAFGIGQWRNDRLDNLKKFAADNKRHLEDIDIQARFVDWELRNTEKYAGNLLKASTNLTEAMRAGISYERPAGWSRARPENGDGWAKRMEYAQSLL